MFIIKAFENFKNDDIQDILYMILEDHGLKEIIKNHVTTSLTIDVAYVDILEENSKGCYCMYKPDWSDTIDVSIIVSETVNKSLYKELRNSFSNRLKSFGYKYSDFIHGKAFDGYHRYYITISKKSININTHQ